MTAIATTQFETGGRIEVWNQFLGSWSGEFEIAAALPGPRRASPSARQPTDLAPGTRYLIRRTTDDEVLPLDFAAEDLRPLN